MSPNVSRPEWLEAVTDDRRHRRAVAAGERDAKIRGRAKNTLVS